MSASSVPSSVILQEALPSSRRAALITFTKSRSLLLLFLLCVIPRTAEPYSVQTHQQLVDLAWKLSIQPLLLKRFPSLTPAQLQEAHAYAYGGCAIQDFGYYPFGNAFFSQLTHYVRSGDFVLSLLRNAQTPDDLAFAIGSLSHYIGDTIGHSTAVNEAVAVEFPKLGRRYGNAVNYAEGPSAHVQTEFAFDINQLSKRRFAPSGYLNFVGLEVPRPLLRTAFYETYGLQLPDIVGSKQTSIRIYRYGVRRFIPAIARAETILHKKSFPEDVDSSDLNELKTDLLLASSDNNWEAYRKKPGFSSHLFAGFIFILPKFGPFKLLSIKGPSSQTENLYERSLNRSIKTLRRVLADFDHIDRYIANRDLDTGLYIKPGGYRLADDTYASLLDRITRHPDQAIPTQLKHDLAEYYADPLAPIVTKKSPQKWAQVQADLQILATMKTVGNLDDLPIDVLQDN